MNMENNNNIFKLNSLENIKKEINEFYNYLNNSLVSDNNNLMDIFISKIKNSINNKHKNYVLIPLSELSFINDNISYQDHLFSFNLLTKLVNKLRQEGILVVGILEDKNINDKVNYFTSNLVFDALLINKENTLDESNVFIYEISDENLMYKYTLDNKNFIYSFNNNLNVTKTFNINNNISNNTLSVYKNDLKFKSLKNDDILLITNNNIESFTLNIDEQIESKKIVLHIFNDDNYANDVNYNLIKEKLDDKVMFGIIVNTMNVKHAIKHNDASVIITFENIDSKPFELEEIKTKLNSSLLNDVEISLLTFDGKDIRYILKKALMSKLTTIGVRSYGIKDNTKVLLSIDYINLPNNESVSQTVSIDQELLNLYFNNVDDINIEFLPFVVNTKEPVKPVIKTNETKEKTNMLNNTMLKRLLLFVCLVGGYIGLMFWIAYNVNIEGFEIFIIFSSILFTYFSLKLVLSMFKNKKKKSKEIKIVNELDFIKAIPLAESSYEELFVEEEDEEEFDDLEEVDFDVSKNILSENYTELEQEALNKLLFDFKVYLESNGVFTTQNNIRTFISSLFSSKLLFFNNFNVSKELKQKFLSLFSEFTGSFYTNQRMSNDYQSLEMLLNVTNSNINEIIESAKLNKDYVHIISFTDVSLENFENNFKKILDYNLTMISSKSFSIPANLWFIFIPKEEEVKKANKLSKLSSFNLSLNIEAKEPLNTNTEVNNNARLSNTFIKEILRDLSEDYYLDESTWKKLDEVNSYLTNHGVDIFDNRVIRQIEKFSTVYKYTDGDSIGLIDDILATKVLPLLSNRHVQKQNEEDETFLELCDRLFGLEDLKQTQIYITKMSQLKEL